MTEEASERRPLKTVEKVATPLFRDSFAAFCASVVR